MSNQASKIVADAKEMHVGKENQMTCLDPTYSADQLHQAIINSEWKEWEDARVCLF